MRIVRNVLWLWWKRWDRHFAPCALVVTPPQLRAEMAEIECGPDGAVAIG